MKKRIVRRRIKGSVINALLLVLISVIVATAMLPISIYAAERVDYSRKGTIYVDLKYKDKAIDNVELTVYKIADAKSKNGNLVFVFTNEFRGFAKDTSSLSESDSPTNLARYIGNNDIYGTPTRTNLNGHAEFNNLDLGIYLVVQTKKCVGYSTMTPFMVYIPYSADGRFYYEIDATPKTDIEKVPEDVTSPNDFWFTDEEGRPTYKDENPNKPTTKPTTTTNLSSLNGNKKPGGHSQLIKTGQNKTIIPALAISGSFAFVIGVLVYKNGKKENG